MCDNGTHSVISIPPDGTGELEGMEDAGLEGNIRRGLWTKACRAIANNVRSVLLARFLWLIISAKPSSSVPERAVYGVLSGDLESVLPMCHTWDDHLWAHLNHLIIARSVRLSCPEMMSLRSS
jgi:hypothetical protein